MSAASIIDHLSSSIEETVADYLRQANDEHNDVDAPVAKAFYEEIRMYASTKDVQALLLEYSIGVIANIEGALDTLNTRALVCFLAALYSTECHTEMVNELTRSRSQTKEATYFNIIVVTDFIIKIYESVVAKMHAGDVVEDAKYEADMDCIITDNNKRYDLMKHTYDSFMSWHTGYESKAMAITRYLLSQGYDKIVAGGSADDVAGGSAE